MTKKTLMAMAAVLICGASVLTSCSNDDNPAGQEGEYTGVPLIIYAGQDVEYTPEQVIADVSWTDAHPIKQVYMQCDCNTGQRMWDVMSVVQAVEGDALFSLSERGTVVLDDLAETIFTSSATGNVRYQLPGSEAWAAQMLGKIRNANKLIIR